MKINFQHGNKIYVKIKKIKNTINSLTSNYDEERIIEFLKDTITGNLSYSYGYGYYKYEFLDKYYSIIYSLLSLSSKYEIITKKNFNKNNNIRELLIIPKKNLKSNILNNNKNYLNWNTGILEYY